MTCFEDALVVLWAVVDLDFILGQVVLVLGFMDMSLIEDDGISSRMWMLTTNTSLVVLGLLYDNLKDRVLIGCGRAPAYTQDRKAWRVKQAERVTGHMQVFACLMAWAYHAIVGAGGDLVGGFVMKVLSAAEGSFDLAFVLPIFAPILDELAGRIFGTCFENLAERSLPLACRGMATGTVVIGLVFLFDLHDGAVHGLVGLLVAWVGFQVYVSVYFRWFVGKEPAENAASGDAEAGAETVGAKA